jgi:hypothetical protein
MRVEMFGINEMILKAPSFASPFRRQSREGRKPGEFYATAPGLPTPPPNR